MNVASPASANMLSRDELIRALPYARRYARALAGGQAGGDRLVANALQTFGKTAAAPVMPARQTLYAAITQQFNEAHHISRIANDERPSGVAQGLDLSQRQLLLLTALEEQKLPEAAEIVGLPISQASDVLNTAREKLRRAAAADILIIEDELVIAMNLEDLVAKCGHRVVGVASSEAAAVEIAARTRPGLILADVNLGIGGDGVSAVARILQTHDVPVIFVTGHPERLLTGAPSEPAFVIAKPFDPLTLAIATYQAVTGGVVFGRGVA